MSKMDTNYIVLLDKTLEDRQSNGVKSISVKGLIHEKLVYIPPCYISVSYGI